MKIFLDDERDPPDDGNKWIVCRTTERAEYFLLMFYRYITFVSWDHDLGSGQPTGMDFAKWLVDQDLNRNGDFIRPDFAFYVHSQNPVGRDNIRLLLDQYLSQR